MNEKQTKALLAAWISLWSNILLTLIKLIVGSLFRSPSLVADGIHNATDVLASAASLGSMKVSQQPADEEHPFGHGKAEVIASGIVAMILFIAAFFMLKESLSALIEPNVTPAHFIVFLAGFISLIWKQVLYLYTKRIGEEAQSKGLIATAYDHLSDVYASLAVVFGVGFGLLGDYFDWAAARYGDPIAGMFVSLIIFRLAYRIAKDAGDILLERNVSETQLNAFRSVILQFADVKRIDRLRAREHGHYIIVDLRIGVPGWYTVQKGHDLTRVIRKTLQDRFPHIQEVLIHLNPWYPET